MKTRLIVILSVVFIAAVWAFNYSINAQDKNDPLKNLNERAKIFNSIAGSQTYMDEFVNMMKNNKSGLRLMVSDLMNISKRDNDVGVRIGDMMLNDQQYMNLMMAQMINKANTDDAFGKSMIDMMKSHNHLYGMMQNMMNSNNMGNNHMGINHMGNSMHNGNSGHSGMMSHGHGMSNGIGSNSSAHTAHQIKR
jgi:hypothetical protein